MQAAFYCLYGSYPLAPAPNRLSDYKIWLFFDSLLSTRWQNFDFPLSCFFVFGSTKAFSFVSVVHLVFGDLFFFSLFGCMCKILIIFIALRYGVCSRWIYFYLYHILLWFRVYWTFCDPYIHFKCMSTVLIRCVYVDMSRQFNATTSLSRWNPKKFFCMDLFISMSFAKFTWKSVSNRIQFNRRPKIRKPFEFWITIYRFCIHYK